MSFVLTNRGWGSQSVPYVIDNASFSQSERRIVVQAIRRWNQQAPTRLTPRTTERDYLFFRRHPRNCDSTVGRKGGRQEVLCAVGGAFGQGNVMHEIGHAMGLLHEHQRPDRNQFIFVTGTSRDLRIKSKGTAALGDYDFNSIMHYPPGTNLKLLQRRQNVGQRNRLSTGDRAGLRWLRRSWQREPGTLMQIAVSRDGWLWGVNARSNIYTKRLADRAWTRVAGGLSVVDVGRRTRVWGINAKGNIFSRSGTKWQRIEGTLTQISIAGDGAIWGVNKQGRIYRRNGNVWQRIPGSLRQVSVGSRNLIWGVNRQGRIYTRTDNRWRRIKGSLACVAVGEDGTVWGVNKKGYVYMRDAAERWVRIAGALRWIDVGSFDEVYGVNRTGKVYSFRE